MRGVKVSVTKYRFLQQLLAPKLRAVTPGTRHRSLENPSETLSTNTVWGNTVHHTLLCFLKQCLHLGVLMVFQELMEAPGGVVAELEGQKLL